MKIFSVEFVGSWAFEHGYEANSKEEAIEMALQDVRNEAFPFGLSISETHVDSEKIDADLVVE